MAGLADCMLNSRNMNLGRIQGMIVGLLEVGRCSEMEINVVRWGVRGGGRTLR